MRLIIVFCCLYFSCVYCTDSYQTARAEVVESGVLWHSGDNKWEPLVPNSLLGQGAAIQTSSTGTLKLLFSEGSRLQLQPNSEILLDALNTPNNQPLILVSLKQGEVLVHIAPFRSFRSFTVATEAAAVIVSDGKPTFSVKQENGVTTAAVEKGTAMVQVDNPELQSVNLYAGEQVSLNLSKMGPLVVAGSPPYLEEPKKFEHRLLDLGQWQECEQKARQNEICGSWSWNRQKRHFEALWQDGSVGILEVKKIGGGEIILIRRDSNNLTARYVGRDAGTEMVGDVALQVIEGTATWKSKGREYEGTWRALSPSSLDLKGE
jgi:hypothetical protein